MGPDLALCYYAYRMVTAIIGWVQKPHVDWNFSKHLRQLLESTSIFIFYENGYLFTEQIDQRTHRIPHKTQKQYHSYQGTCNVGLELSTEVQYDHIPTLLSLL